MVTMTRVLICSMEQLPCEINVQVIEYSSVVVLMYIQRDTEHDIYEIQVQFMFFLEFTGAT